MSTISSFMAKKKSIGLFHFLFSRMFLKNILYAAVFIVVVIGGLWFGLNVYTDHGEYVEVPYVEGLSVEEAGAQFDEVGLDYFVRDSIWSAGAVGGLVNDQLPGSGAKVKTGRKVDLTIYRHAAESELLGIKEGDVGAVAMLKLRNKGIDFNSKYESNVLLNGMVIRVERKGKRLEPDSRVTPGEDVTLVIGKLGDERVYVPNCYGMSLDSAEIRLTNANLSVGSTLYDGEFPTALDSALARVYRQVPNGKSDSTARIGSAVDLWLKDIKAKTDVDIDRTTLDYEKK